MKLFNKQRYRLQKGSRIKKYLLYAIGEIILVVIGILIAVSINNYNEANNLEADTEKTAKQIVKKLQADLTTIAEVEASINDSAQKYDLYLKPDKTKEERLTTVVQAPFLVTISVQLLPLNSISPSMLDRAVLNKSALSDKLIEIQEDYTSLKSGLHIMDDIITKELLNNINHIKDNYDWYEKLVADESNFTTEEYKYFGTKDYKNRVVHMKFLYIQGYKSMLNETEYILQRHLKELEAIL